MLDLKILIDLDFWFVISVHQGIAFAHICSIIRVSKFSVFIDHTLLENEYGPLTKQAQCKSVFCKRSKYILEILLVLWINAMHVKEV